MKIAVAGLPRRLIEKILPDYGFKVDRKNPDIVISVGGDGTALYAERIYPGIPKIMVKHSKVCEKCNVDSDDLSKVLVALKEKKYKIVEEIKVEGLINNNPRKKLIGLNEISIHHRIPTKAIRLRIKIDGKVIDDELIGDGIVIATPYGSTAYFYSITRKKFSKGLGLGFNNPKEIMKPIFLNENSVVEAEVVRGYGLVTADNDDRMIPIRKGDMLKVQKSKQKAKIIQIYPI
jgi:NAD+ kinase